MADHCRKQIRDALAAGLAGMTTVDAIHTGRVHPLAGLPALLIFTNEEAVESLLNKSEDDRRALTVTIEGHAEGDGVVDALDAIAAEVEASIDAAVPVWVKDIVGPTTTVELSGDGDTPSGLIRLDFEVFYHANMAAPDTPL